MLSWGLVSGLAESAPPPASTSNLVSADWSVSASPNLASKPPAQQIVESFIRAEQHYFEGESFLGDGEYVCSFRFADLRHNGFLSLAFGIGVTDRPSCSDIYIIDKVPSGFEMYRTAGEVGAGSDIPDAVADLGNDGKFEFLLDKSFASIEEQCRAT